MVKVIKEKFVVIGKEGSTLDGEGFIQKLWDDANSHFSEVAHLAKKDANGGIVGIWGAMSDISRSFKPWEDGFSKGLYLAGVECVDNAELLQVERLAGYSKISLSVQKSNYAVKMYEKVGFTVADENNEEYIMIVNL